MHRATLRRSAMALAALALAATSCTASRVDANAEIDLTGSLAHQDGSPVPGARVALVEQPGFDDVFFTVFSLGLTCLTDELPNMCRGARRTSTADDGTFAFHLRGRDTQGTVGTASTMELSARMDRGDDELEGPAVAMDFLVQTARLNLPLRFWGPRVKATGNARDLRITWPRLPGDILPARVSLADIETDVRFQAAGGAEVWTYSGVGSGKRLDARLIEDASGTLSVVARAGGIEVPDEAGSRVGVRLRSARLPYESPGSAPVSRNTACLVEDGGGRPVAQASCGLTDGDFAAEFAQSIDCDDADCVGPARNRVTIDLGRARTLDLIAVRGCNGPCTVESSRDAKTWRTVGTGGRNMGENIALRLARPERARYLRVAATGGIHSLREVSAWEPATTGGAMRSILVAVGTEGTGTPPKARTESESPATRSLRTLAAIILVAIVAFALGRRRRARAH